MGNEMPLRQIQILSAEDMFKQVILKLEEEGKFFRYAKSHLNTEKLVQANWLKPTVLIINCHGEKDRTTGKTSFCFENTDHYSLIQKIGEDDLVYLL